MNNQIFISDKTKYSLRQVKEIFKNFEIAGNSEDEIINYALQLIVGINSVKLPEKGVNGD